MNNLYIKLNKKYENNIPLWIKNSLKNIKKMLPTNNILLKTY